MKKSLLLVIAASLVAACQTTSGNEGASARSTASPDFGDFGPWFNAERSIGGDAYRRVTTTTSDGGQMLMEQFSVASGQCVGRDCQNNSSRQERQENIYDYPRHGSQRQPKEAWYGWEIMLAEGTAWGTDQAIGPIILGQFKQGGVNCPLFIFKHQAGYTDPAIEMALPRGTGLPEGEGDCVQPVSSQAGDVRQLIGTWGRIELFVRWAPDETGLLVGYFNGRKVMEHRGATCVEDCENIYFKYGIYYANQRERASKPVTAFYRNVSRSLDRKSLVASSGP
ncbi:heparin lyase I family protein [Ovoidimarina sediminis]|uniref:heparin lyase I family protein n=1 Tax=Ovoidimarina sediminis TaxID=3079856 RepID=UPI00290635CC|nr:heparin lyase I family protein [Rhodophyticola sp. MJ-SS7]MDU8946429.1 heparin lyase I family protein [Rhodophyticola sp. MJ-SS7]